MRLKTGFSRQDSGHRRRNRRQAGDRQETGDGRQAREGDKRQETGYMGKTGDRRREMGDNALMSKAGV